MVMEWHKEFCINTGRTRINTQTIIMMAVSAHHHRQQWQNTNDTRGAHVERESLVRVSSCMTAAKQAPDRAACTSPTLVTDNTHQLSHHCTTPRSPQTALFIVAPISMFGSREAAIHMTFSGCSIDAPFPSSQ